MHEAALDRPIEVPDGAFSKHTERARGLGVKLGLVQAREVGVIAKGRDARCRGQVDLGGQLGRGLCGFQPPEESVPVVDPLS